jgi:hypothetical protein
MCGRHERGGAANGPYQAYKLTRGRRRAGSENALVSALGELTALGTERDREQLAAVLDRLDAALGRAARAALHVTGLLGQLARTRRDRPRAGHDAAR